MDTLNSTVAETTSGEQAGAVAPQESPTEPTTEDSGAGLESVVGSQIPDFALVDKAEEQEETREEPPARTPAQQTPEENARYRSMRLRAQHEAEAEAAARMDAEIAGAGVINPYTNKPFASLKELAAYGARVRQAELAKRAKETGRPLAELEEDAANRAFLSELRRRANRPAPAPQDEAAAFIERDVTDFLEKYPDFNAEGLSALENNPQFRRFCGSRFGREPLAELYGAYLELVGAVDRAAEAKAVSRGTRSTGSGTGGGATLSPSQRAALQRWNAEHPEMAMTAKEYLSR